MVKTGLVLCCILGFGWLFSVENPLNPRDPVVINDTDFGIFSVSNPIAGANTDGYMVTYATFLKSEGGTHMSYSFSEDGLIWTSGVILFSSQTSVPIWNVGTPAGFLASFPFSTPGAPTFAADSTFSSDQGENWAAFSVIDAGTSVSFTLPVPCLAVPGGVMATWKESTTNFTSFSSDNGATWSLGVQVGTSTTVNTAPILAINSSGVLATWRDTTGLAALSAFSSDLGASWSAQSTIASNVGGEVFCSANEDGFIAVWVDFSAFEVLSSFSTDQGATWSSPTTVTTDLSLNTNVRAFVTTTDPIALADLNGEYKALSETDFPGFIVTWVDSSGDANASFSDDNGATWSDPVLITDDGSVSLISKSFVTAVCEGNECLFTWKTTTDANVMASLAALGTIPPDAPTGIFGVQKKDDFGLQFELFNFISWSASSSVDVAGYNVYRDAVKIAILPADTLFFEDHNQPKDVSRTYQITAFAADGTEGDPATVIVN